MAKRFVAHSQIHKPMSAGALYPTLVTHLSKDTPNHIQVIHFRLVSPLWGNNANMIRPAWSWLMA